MNTLTANTSGGSRVRSVDLLRGLVMLLVALDILRYFIFGGYGEPMNLEGTNAPLFFTRWITHYFAPIFLLLAGTGVYLKQVKGQSKKQISIFLLTRGLFLIALEVVVVGFLWKFQFNIYPILFQFIWVLGASMMVLAGLIWLPVSVIAGLSLITLFGHNLLDGFSFGDGYWQNIFNGVFHKEAVICLDVCKEVRGEVFYAFISYPLVPWFAVMGLGYALGALYQMDGKQRRKIFLFGGLAATILFFIVRAWLGFGENTFGNPAPWSEQENALWTAMSFLNTEKYPPSLSYLLMTLGPAALLLFAFDKVKSGIAGFFEVFGRVPIFFYVVQFLLAHVLALILGVAQGFQVDQFLTFFWRFPEGFGLSLLWVYVAWFAVVALMYPLCEWYADLRAKKKSKLLEYF